MAEVPVEVGCYRCRGNGRIRHHSPDPPNTFPCPEPDCVNGLRIVWIDEDSFEGTAPPVLSYAEQLKHEPEMS